MTQRTLWTVTFALCLIGLIAGFVYTWQLPREQSSPLPMLLAIPAAVLAQVAWRRLRRAA